MQHIILPNWLSYALWYGKKNGGKKIKLCPQAKYNVFWGFLNPIFIAELFQDYILPPVSRLERLEEHFHAKVVKVFQRETAMGPARLLCKFCRGEKAKNIYTERILRRVHGRKISKRI